MSSYLQNKYNVMKYIFAGQMNFEIWFIDKKMFQKI